MTFTSLLTDGGELTQVPAHTLDLRVYWRPLHVPANPTILLT